MTQARGWKPTLRYSPANGIIVDWGIGNEPFSMCCMPEPSCEGPAPVPTPKECCDDLPVIQEVDTYDWYRWVPEIMAGFPDASEDMASTYARTAAREFAQKAHVLKRQIGIKLQHGVYRYPLEPFEDEQVQGVMEIDSPQGGCGCESNQHGLNIGAVRVDQARSELVIEPTHGCCGHHVGYHGPHSILVTVWSAPTEDSCKHDVFLYEQYRREITKGARSAMISDVLAMGSYKTSRGYANFRGDQMMFNRADTMRREFEKAMSKARVEAHTGNKLVLQQPGPLFASGCCAPHRRH